MNDFFILAIRDVLLSMDEIDSGHYFPEKAVCCEVPSQLLDRPTEQSTDYPSLENVPLMAADIVHQTLLERFTDFSGASGFRR